MYAPLSPILAANSADEIDTHELLQRLEALAVVLAAVRRLAGSDRELTFDALAVRAELAVGLALLPIGTLERVARQADTLSAMLHAGLLGLERSRSKGRLNRAAADLLHKESVSEYRHLLRTAGVAQRN